MHVIMIKKRLADGEPCRKCRQTQEMLENRGLWSQIDEVVWAQEGDDESPGMVLAREHGVEIAPFFVVTDDDGRVTVYKSALKLVRERLEAAREAASGKAKKPFDINELQSTVEAGDPVAVLRRGLERFGAECAIAFSGAEDVALIDMAAKLGLPFSVFSLDTGRLHPETYRFIEDVRVHYGIDIAVISPPSAELEQFVRRKGLFSFYDDGHGECCRIRKVVPLKRALSGYRAWVTGQRRDQNPDTRSEVMAIEIDERFRGLNDGQLVKLNPLAAWTSRMVWDYIHANEVPYNPLHRRGFISIGCAPCTRPVLPGQPERAGRWWWEQSEHRECGLHRD